jgi:intein-encoded DNA endonuclease-like protein
MVSVLTSQEKEDVVRLYQAGKSTPNIAEKYGVSSTAINGILKRRNVELRNYSQSKMIYGLNVDYFQSIDCEEKSYWLGFLAADGNVTDKAEIRVTLSAKDSNHLFKFKESVESTHPIKLFEANGFRYVTFGFKNQKMASDLNRHGIVPRKTHVLQPPKTVPLNSIRHYIRGYVDGDGGFNGVKQPNFRVTSTLEVVLWIQDHLIEKCDLRRKTKLIQRNKSSEIYTINYSGLRQVLRIGHYLYDGSSVFLDRKKNYIDLLPSPARKRRIDA